MKEEGPKYIDSMPPGSMNNLKKPLPVKYFHIEGDGSVIAYIPDKKIELVFNETAETAAEAAEKLACAIDSLLDFMADANGRTRIEDIRKVYAYEYLRKE